jgi:hypothetical protein
MQLCSSDTVSNFLFIAKMQQHDLARRPGLHFAASPNASARVQNVLRLRLLSSCKKFYIEELKKKGANNPSNVLFLFILPSIKS